MDSNLKFLLMELFRLYKSKGNVCNFSNKNIEELPPFVGNLQELSSVDLKNNLLSYLPDEFRQLTKITTLNLGNNQFSELPLQLSSFPELRVLHLFSNKIKNLDDFVLESLRNLKLLNLNNNRLDYLPSHVYYLRSLKVLSLSGNQLSSIPDELCLLSKLQELYLDNNRLQTLPMEIGLISQLRKLHLQHNNLKELPESIVRLLKLTELDVAANHLRIFPTQMAEMPLKVLHCEHNQLLERMPVQSIQEEEVLSLKEITVRLIMKLVKVRGSYVRRMVRFYPVVRDTLSQCSQCAVCGHAFLNTWLECVRFITSQQMRCIHGNNVIPVRALVCSYKCFNSESHGLFGVAFLNS